jgi:hypothetical protein
MASSMRVVALGGPLGHRRAVGGSSIAAATLGNRASIRDRIVRERRGQPGRGRGLRIIVVEI